MQEWWQDLTPLCRGFYSAASFFSVFMVWQLIAALTGLDGDDGDIGDAGDVGGDVDADGTYHDFETGAHADSAETAVAFQLLSIRSILGFCTLFSWAGAMYLNDGVSTQKAIAIAFVWGIIGMVGITSIMYLMKKLTHTGTANLRSCVGTVGTVYLNIPENGFGEVKVTVGDAVSHIKARSSTNKSLSANTSVRVVKCLDKTTVEVEPITEEK